LKSQAVYIAWINPASIKAHRDSVATPARARLYFASPRRHDSKKFMGVGKDTFAWTDRDDRMIRWDATKWFDAIFITPLFVRYGFLCSLEVSANVALVEWIINRVILGPLCSVVIITECYIQAGMTDVFWVKRSADNVAAFYCI